MSKSEKIQHFDDICDEYGLKVLEEKTCKSGIDFGKYKGFKVLYLYYCYLLKVYPKKNMECELTPVVRAEVKKVDEYSNEIKE